MREVIIYADESVSKGAKFSNFFGGSLIQSHDLHGVANRLNAIKDELMVGSEMKWQKVTAQYLDRYVKMIGAFFDEVQGGRVKFRVMFTQNRHQASWLTREQRENSYFLLYYQFIKHAFGLPFVPNPTRVRLLFDELPDSLDRRRAFRQHLAALSSQASFRHRQVVVDPDVGEVRSHDHIVLQCTDVVLGAMQFKLNGKNRERPENARRRASRTIAKEQLYKEILARIRTLRPGFNIGISTGTDGDRANRWHHAYRHWLFVPQAPGQEE